MIRPFAARTLARSALPTLAAVALAVPAWGNGLPPQEGRSPAALEVQVLDRDGDPVPGLTAGDFLVEAGDRDYRVTDLEEQTAGEARRRFVFVFNRRGADASQLSRALRGLGAFIEEGLGDSDESLFADLGETLRLGRAFGPGKEVARMGLEAIPAMGYRSPTGAGDDAAVAAKMLEMVTERLAATPGRKIMVFFSGSLSSFGEMTEQPGFLRKPDVPMIRFEGRGRGEEDAGLASITRRLSAAQTTVHVLHLAGVLEYENRILTAERGEFDPRQPFSSTSYLARERAVSPRSADDILSSLAAETGGLYFARATGFRTVLERIESRHRTWYRLTLDGGAFAATLSHDLAHDLAIRVPDCPTCRVLAGRQSDADGA